MTEPGRQFGGRYEVVSPIASGGMAEVFLAQDRLLGRRVAVKVLHPEYARDGVFIERFRREAQAAAGLNDPGIVSVFDWGSDEGTYYLVMEFAEGRTLRDVIAAEGPLDGTRSAQIAADVCSALQFAHDGGIVHRDVKPGNIIITDGGQTKVMDFGIARGAQSGQTVTQTGTVMGTASYLSPEQAQGLSVDARSDVYSSGVVLYEMLTGRVPFEADTAVAVAYKHVQEEPVPPGRANGSIPEALEAVVMKALAKNPENRYQSAGEMGADLQRFLRGDSVVATPLLFDEPTTAIPRQDRTQVIPQAEVPKGPKALAYTLIFLLFLGIVVGAVAGAIALFGPDGATVPVPDVIGEPQEEATRILDSAGLVGVVVSSQFHETIPAGSVIAQDPTEGHKLQEGSRVELTISSGAELVEVPDLVGLSEDDALSALAEAGLVLGERTVVFSEEVAKGSIVSQEPRSGTMHPRGSAVDVEVSGGGNQVKVPRVIGLTEANARKRIEDANLVPVVQVRCDTDESNDSVIEQSPSPGVRLPEGSEVVFTVNKAPRIPNVVKETEEDARNELEAAGFQVEVTYVVDPLKAGEVVEQNPKGRAKACAGDTVTITVAR